MLTVPIVIVVPLSLGAPRDERRMPEECWGMLSKLLAGTPYSSMGDFGAIRCELLTVCWQGKSTQVVQVSIGMPRVVAGLGILGGDTIAYVFGVEVAKKYGKGHGPNDFELRQ
jgi:hypothetical protein